MKVIMDIEKLVLFGDGICGNMDTGDIVSKRKNKNWNTKSRREKMLNKVKEHPERFISNYRWMKNDLGALDCENRIKDGIAKLFAEHKRHQVVIFEKEPGRRQSMDGNIH